MHTIFQTEAFVLKSTPLGEANKQLDLFTKDFGLIRGSAQGVRYLKSKLRYSLTDFSYCNVSLVRGKEFFRVTTASKIGDVTKDIESVEAKESMYRIFALLRRLLQGEESHPELFLNVQKTFEAMKTSTKEASGIIEEVSVLRTLYLLGYVKEDKDFMKLIKSYDFNEEILSISLVDRKKVVNEINRALNASNL